MNKVQSAILPAAMLGSIIIAVFAFLASSMMNIPATWLQPIVAHAEAPTPTPELPAPAAAAADPAPAGEEASAQPAECAISPAFPQSIQQWCELITRYAGENGLEPNLVASVMLQESGGDPVAYSKSGAVGLLQVMPRDGLAANFMCKNGPCFTNRPSIAELQDPEYNVSYGTGMLAGLLSRHGNIRDALKYYGPADVGYYYADIVLSIFNRYQ